MDSPGVHFSAAHGLTLGSWGQSLRGTMTATIGRGVSLFAAALAGALAKLPAAAAATVMITGANSGIGLEFAKQYAVKGWTVIATHRRAEPPKTLTDLQAQYPKVRIETLDVTNLEQAKGLAAKLSGVPIDVLINNAGVYNDPDPGGSRPRCNNGVKAVGPRCTTTSAPSCDSRLVEVAVHRRAMAGGRIPHPGRAGAGGQSRLQQGKRCQSDL